MDVFLWARYPCTTTSQAQSAIPECFVPESRAAVVHTNVLEKTVLVLLLRAGGGQGAPHSERCPEAPLWVFGL